jgi:hypothetical protein
MTSSSADPTDPVATIVDAIVASGYAAISCGHARKARVDGRARRAC